MINNNSVNENTTESAFPSAYRISDITITNAYGKSFDIKALVTGVTVTESIYSLALVATVEIRDTANLFEEMRISGQELVEITFQKRDRNSKENVKVKKQFYVSEIPIYGKLKDAVQGYSLTCVSPHAFINHVQSISRAVTGSISKAIRQIVSGDLEYSGDIQSDLSSKGNVKLIIPNMKPFTAISWLLRHAYAGSGTPLYAYEAFDGFKIISHEYLTTLDPIGLYKFNFLQEPNPNTPEGYEAAKYKILNMSSELNSSKYIHSARGAYASTTRVLDVAKKKYYDIAFDYDKRFKQMPNISNGKGKRLISSAFKVKDQTLNHHHDALYIYLNENSMAFEGHENYHGIAIHSIGQHQAMLENFDTTKHSITIHGDLNINAGKKISIEAPKSIDPQVYKNIREKDAKKSATQDMMISGDYLITSVKHTFAADYSCSLSIKRDYSNYSLDSAD